MWAFAPPAEESRQIVQGPLDTLPVNWTNPLTGGSISNLPSLDDPDLAAIGWLRYVDNRPDTSGVDTVGSTSLEFGDGTVTVVYTMRPKTPEELAAELNAAKAAKRAALAATRYTHEIGGTTVAGASLLTDRESQGLLTGAALAATLDPNYTVTWKAANGWVTLDAPTLIAMAQAVRAHVQACFDREKTLDDAIAAAATVADVEAVDITTGWP